MRPLAWLCALPLLSVAGCQAASAGAAPDAAPQATPSTSVAQPPVSAVSAPLPPQPASSASAAPSSSDAGAHDAGPPSACPEGMAPINKFCVDRWEAHLVSLDDAGHEVIHPHFERPSEGVAYLARSAAGVFPQGYISRVEAAAACKRAGKRLCSRNEWLRACQGKRWWTWPYGATAKRGKCNNGKVHLLSQMFGTQGRSWKYDEHFNSPRLNQEPGFLAKAGEYAECSNAEGAFDMVGNLHEWVSDSVDDAFVESFEAEEVERRTQPHRTGNGVFMGGFFSTTSELGPGCKYTTIAHEPTYHDYSTGFRCCRKQASPPKK